MGIIMRISQQFVPSEEDAFMQLEKKFHELELARPDYPKGKRMQPISAHEPMNTLIWQYEFKDMQTANDTLNFFKGDEGHEVDNRYSLFHCVFPPRFWSGWKVANNYCWFSFRIRNGARETSKY